MCEPTRDLLCWIREVYFSLDKGGEFKGVVRGGDVGHLRGAINYRIFSYVLHTYKVINTAFHINWIINYEVI